MPQPMVMLYAVEEGAVQHRDLTALMLADELTDEQHSRLARSPALYLGEVGTPDQSPRIAPPVAAVLDLLGTRPRTLTEPLMEQLLAALAGHNLSHLDVATNLRAMRTWLSQRIGKVVYTVHWGRGA